MLPGPNLTGSDPREPLHWSELKPVLHSSARLPTGLHHHPRSSSTLDSAPGLVFSLFPTLKVGQCLLCIIQQLKWLCSQSSRLWSGWHVSSQGCAGQREASRQQQHSWSSLCKTKTTPSVWLPIPNLHTSPSCKHADFRGFLRLFYEQVSEESSWSSQVGVRAAMKGLSLHKMKGKDVRL